MSGRKRARETIRIDPLPSVECGHCGHQLDTSPLDPFDRVACSQCGSPIEVPGTIDQFLVWHRIDQGGMGVIFHAEDRELRREVAIKSIRADVASDREELETLMQEAQAAANLNHPNIATIFSLETSEQGVYIVMEYIDGPSLKEALEGPLAPSEVVRIATALASALEEADRIGLTHSDIKPGNILLTPEGEPKLVDFGLAKFHDQRKAGGKVWGSPFYVAPERLAGKAETPRSDQYSLGCVLWEAMTGRRPFKGADQSETLARVREGEIERLSQSPVAGEAPQCARIIDRMMARDPARRYPNYASLLTDLKQAKASLENAGTSGRQTPSANRHGLPRRFWIALGGLGLLLTAGGMAVMSTWEPSTPHPSAPPTAQTQPKSPPPRSPEPAPSPPPATKPGPNLLANPGFEETKQKVPEFTAWFLGAKKDIRRKIVQDRDTRSQCVEITTLRPQQFGRLIQKITLEPKTRYRLSARIKATDIRPATAKSGGAGLMIRDQENKRPPFGKTNSLTGSTGWMEVRSEFRTPPNIRGYKVMLTIGMSGKAQGQARFDDIRLQRLP